MRWFCDIQRVHFSRATLGRIETRSILQFLYNSTLQFVSAYFVTSLAGHGL